MTIFTPRPVTVTQVVRRWVESRRTEAKKYDNVTFAIDASGIYDLHEMAAKVYADGFNDGVCVGFEQARSERGVSASTAEVLTGIAVTGRFIRAETPQCDDCSECCSCCDEEQLEPGTYLNIRLDDDLAAIHGGRVRVIYEEVSA